MGNKIEIKLLIFCLLFVFTCAFIYSPATPTKNIKNVDLGKYFKSIDGYTTLRRIKLEDNAIQMLKLDDYAYYDYQGPIGKINLYIGYYSTAKKAYASHSPLVCYPSQGWNIDSGPIRSTLRVNSLPIYLEEVITSYGRKREMVFYWYQSHLDTNTQAYRNKISMGINKIKYNDERHAFVRISTTITDNKYDEAKSRLVFFIQAFYPKFIVFINEN